MQRPEDGAAAGESEDTTTASTGAGGLLDDLARLGRGLRQLFGAQLRLLGAELDLARSAVVTLLVMALAATVFGVGLGLTLLGLVGVLLARWFGTWVGALAALALLQVLCLLAAMWMFRRCLHWLSLPATRREWHAMMRDTLRKARKQIDAESDAEKPPHETVP
jgi:uncharacterized membrane protein YqjE